MNRRAAALVLVVGALLPGTAACAAPAVGPLPIEAAPSPSPSPTASPPAMVVTVSPSAPRTSASRTRPASPTLTSTLPSACLGAVVYTIPADSELALIRALCFAAGAMLRIEGTGPGTVTAEPGNLADSNYEGGVVEIRFVRPGTVVVRITRGGQTFPITVVVR